METIRRYSYTEPSNDGLRKVVYQEGSTIMKIARIHSITVEKMDNGYDLVTVFVENERKEIAKWKEIRESATTPYVKEFNWVDILL